MLSAGGKPGAKLIKKRMNETADAVLQMRAKQRILADMLRGVAPGQTSAPVDKEMWVELLRAAGMDQEAMARWHRAFERRSPLGHCEFLVSLGLAPDEVKKIRAWAQS